MGQKSSVRQFLVKVDGIDGTFATIEGGSISSQATKVYDGGVAKPSIITSQAEADDVTVTRSYEHDRDADIMEQLRQLVGAFEATVSKTPLDANLVAIGKPVVYPNARLTGFQEPTGDAAGTDPAMWGLVFSIPDWQ